MNKTVLLDLDNPEQALELYLEALLREAPLTPEVQLDHALVTTAPRGAVAIEATVQDEAAVPVRTRDLELRAEPIAPPITVSIELPNPAPAGAPPAPPVTPSPANIPGVPFQSLMFQVAGLTVAVPLVELNAILRYPERLVAVPGLPAWGLGVLRHREANLIVVDSIELFVPESLRAASRSRAHPSYLVVLGDGRFGLACDSVNQVVTLQPDEIHWRGERGRRPWLAGTVKERLCALLDVPSLVRLLSIGRLETNH